MGGAAPHAEVNLESARPARSPALDAPIFIGGMPRSGTTLLRVILDSHPAIACGPELRALPTLASLSASTRAVMGADLAAHYDLPPDDLDDAFADLIRSFLGPYAARAGKARIAEKTPANVLHFVELARLFPKARFVQIVRDGRDVVASLLGMDWRDGRTGARLAITTDPAAAAAAWVEHVRRGRRVAAAGAPYFEIRYETLIADPRAALAPLFAFLGEPFADEVLEFRNNPSVSRGQNESSAAAASRSLNADSAGRWRRDLSQAARAVVRREAGALLSELGYAHDGDW